MTAKTSYPYRLAKLDDRDGDPTQRWRITFYAWDINSERLVRKQKWISEKFKTKAQKSKEANKLIQQINKLLVNGYHIGEGRPKDNTPSFMTVEKAFQWVYDLKKASVRESSEAKYDLILGDLKAWLKQSGYQALPIQNLSFETCEKFLNWFRMERELGNSSYNTYLSYFKSYLNFLVKKEKIQVNPARNIEFLKVDETEDTIFPPDVKEKLLQAYSPKLKVMAQFIYYTFIRPGELRKLKVKHVREKSIFIPGNIAKNRKSAHILITPPLERLIEKLGIRDMPSEYYLIGQKGYPSLKQCSRNTFSNGHLDIRREMQLPEEYTFYCWKHTGVTDAYLATKDVVFISKQCRHSSLDMTMKYLRGLGLMLEYSEQESLPDLGLMA